MSFDLSYTDKPFVYSETARERAPRNDFKRHSNSYTVGDVWISDEAMKEYVITTDMVVKLKTCFERMNRKSKKAKRNGNKSNCVNSSLHERLRLLFNQKYMKLRQMVVKTNYRYNLRRFIITPPITQSTYQYDSLLRYICRLDSLSPHELQEKRVKKNTQNNASSGHHKGRYGGNRRGSNKVNLVDNAALQRIWKDFITVELVNKSIKDQTQGGKSFLKQVVLAGKHFNSCYGKVLPDPTLAPDEIGIPSCVMESQFRGAEMNKAVLILKRDPVFSSDAITMVMKIKRNPYPYITLPSEIITQKQLDFDGDTVTLYILMSPDCFIETAMRISAKVSMYCYFSRTRLTFSQTNGFRIYGLLKEIDDEYSDDDESKNAEVKVLLGNTFEYCRRVVHSSAKTSEQLFETLLSLAQQYVSFVAYGFVLMVREASFGGRNQGKIYPIGPDPKEMAMHIAESGSKGSKDSVNHMFDFTDVDDAGTISGTINYAKLFIEAKNVIKKQGHNAKKMDSAFQNIILNHDSHMVMKVNNINYDLGHVVNYVQRDWVFSDLTTLTILNHVHEAEDSMVAKAIGLGTVERWENEINAIMDVHFGIST